MEIQRATALESGEPVSELKQNKTLIILILGALSTIGPFSIDMYLPAFAEIARDLNTSVGRVSLSVSSYFIGLAIGQMIYGPLLDRFGRRGPLFAGLMIYFLSSLACMFTHHVEWLIAFRVMQALGGCSTQVACTAMVRDFFPARDAAKVFSMLFLMISVSPLIAPSLGSFVVLAFGWQAVFGILAFIALAIALTTYFYLPEGHQADKSVSLEPRRILKDFAEILKNRQFLAYTLGGSFSFAGLFVYVTASPAIFIDAFQMSKQAYGGIFALLSVAFIGGSQLNLYLTRHFSNEQIFKFFLITQTIVAVLFLAVASSVLMSLNETVFFLFMYLIGVGISYPNAAALAISPFAENAGRASSLLGFLQMGIGALMSTGVGLSRFSGLMPTVVTLAIASSVGLLVFLKLQPKAREVAALP